MNVFFFGDSIFSGQYVSPHKVWVTRVASKLDELQTDDEIRIINASVSGNTTRMALERMSYDVQSHGVDLISIQFGLNDCNYWETDNGLPRVGKLAFEGNLHEIIDRAITFGAKKVFINTNHPTGKYEKMPKSSITYQESNEQYNNIVRKVAQQRNDVQLNDVEKFIKDYLSKNNLPLESIVLPDMIHLSELGHDVYYEFIAPRIVTAVKEMIGQ